MSSPTDPFGNPRASRAIRPAPVTASSSASAAGAVDAAAGASAGLAAVVARLKHWFGDEGYWYATSAVVHAIGFVIVALVVTFLPGLAPSGESPGGDVPVLEPADADAPDPDLTKFDPGPIQENPSSQIGVEAVTLPPSLAGSPVSVDNPLEPVPEGGGLMREATGPELGGLGAFSVQGLAGPGGPGGVGVGVGPGLASGTGGGRGLGIGTRTIGVGNDGTRAEDRAILSGLVWLAKHQGPSGFWSLQHSRFCPPKSGCGGQGSYTSDVAATALTLLAFEGAGQTHQTRNGPFTKQIAKGLTWLLSQQASDGSIARHGNDRGSDHGFGEPKPMYTHALATIVLCENYAMTHDPKVGAAAAKAIRFIESAQNEATGGWRYYPHDPGDTSVVGWQVMALKCAQMAGLGVNSQTLDAGRKWLTSVATGRNQGLFRYQPYRAEDRSMTAVGQLCLQYMGSALDDPALLEGKQYLLQNLPDSGNRDVYYWYYATLVMHNYLDADYDKWMRPMRRILVNSQGRDGCGTGSWDPELPTMDPQGYAGGRLYMTTLSVLTLEVHYRYLALFGGKGNRSLLDSPPAKAAPAASDASEWKPSSRL